MYKYLTVLSAVLLLIGYIAIVDDYSDISKANTKITYYEAQSYNTPLFFDIARIIGKKNYNIPNNYYNTNSNRQYYRNHRRQRNTDNQKVPARRYYFQKSRI